MFMCKCLQAGIPRNVIDVSHNISTCKKHSKRRMVFSVLPHWCSRIGIFLSSPHSRDLVVYA